MRINSISNYSFLNCKGCKRRNVSFGKFLDKNADKFCREQIFGNTTKESGPYYYLCERRYERLKDCNYAGAYTDTDGKVKPWYDDEFLKNYTMGDGRNLVEYHKISDEICDYETEGIDAEIVSHDIRLMDEMIAGKTFDQVLEEEYPKSNSLSEPSGIDCAKRNAEEMPYW